MNQIICVDCGGKGQRLCYSHEDFEGAEERNACGGKGYVFLTKNNRITERKEKMTGSAQIHNERVRQLEEEGCSSEHDDIQDEGQLLYAAIAYIYAARGLNRKAILDCWWPWGRRLFKNRGGAIRCLVKAAALIAAEIDRLQRLEAKDWVPDEPYVANVGRE